MPEAHPASSKVRFGPFELDRESGQLLKEGRRIKLQDQPFQILCILLEQPGRVVTREELKNRVWPADTFVEFDQGLYSAIRRLRDTLNDSAETPRYIETLARRGYRFISSFPESGPQNASELSRIAASAQSQLPPAEAVRANQRTHIVWALACLTVLGLALVGARWYFQPPAISPLRARWVITPPDQFIFHASGDAGGPVAVSPDGQQLAFAALDANGRQQLWVRPLDGLQARPLPGTEAAYYPFWSPDSRSLGFFSNGQLKRLDVAGGSVATICHVASARGGTWNQQGVILFAPDLRGGLYRVPASGGDPTPVTQVDFSHNDSHRWPYFLPDGQHFLYLATTHTDLTHSHEAAYVASLDGKESKLLLASHAKVIYASGYLLFVNDATLMAQPFDLRRLELVGTPSIVERGVDTNMGWRSAVFSASQNGILAYAPAPPDSGNRLVWSSRTGKQLGVVGDIGRYGSLRLSPDGQQLAVEHQQPSHHLWIYDLKRNAKSQFTFGSSGEAEPVWSPDGKKIVFASERKGHTDLYWKSVAGLESEALLLESPLNKFPLDWSPDGKFLLYVETDHSFKSNLWALPMSGPQKPRLLLTGDFYSEDGYFSPDGHWITYVSLEQGTNQAFVIPFPGPGNKKQISPAGGIYPVWRKDGKAVFYVDDSGTLQETEVDFRNLDLAVGSTRALFPGNVEILPDQSRTYDAAPDGRLIINTRKQENQTLIVVVSNWSTGQRK